MKKKASNEEKRTLVGSYFEERLCRLFGGALTRNDDGDFVLGWRNTTVEVKSSGSQSSYGFRLGIDQIGRYRERAEFPFDHAWYVFVAYRNPTKRDKETGRKRSRFAEHTTVDAIHRYLGQHVEWCLVVDLSIVESWRDKLPHSRKSIVGQHRGAETVDIKCAMAYSFSNGGLRTGLEDFGLNPEDFRRLQGVVDIDLPDLLDRNTVRLPLTVVLPLAEVDTTKWELREHGIFLQETPY